MMWRKLLFCRDVESDFDPGMARFEEEENNFSEEETSEENLETESDAAKEEQPIEDKQLTQTELVKTITETISNQINKQVPKEEGEDQEKLQDLSLPNLVNSPEELEQLISDPKLFNQKLNDMTNNAIKSIIPYIVGIVGKTTQAAQRQQNLVNQFYNENKDLAQYKSLVQNNSVIAAQQHPDWDVERLLKETAKTTREQLMNFGKQFSNSSAFSKSSRELTHNRKRKPKNDVDQFLEAFKQ